MSHIVILICRLLNNNAVKKLWLLIKLVLNLINNHLLCVLLFKRVASFLNLYTNGHSNITISFIVQILFTTKQYFSAHEQHSYRKWHQTKWVHAVLWCTLSYFRCMQNWKVITKLLISYSKQIKWFILETKLMH